MLEFHSEHQMPAQGPRRGPVLAWVGAAAVVAILAAGAWTFRATLTGKAATGSLRIESQPAGAIVDIDGKARGLTPITVELAPGAHVVAVTHNDDTQEISTAVTAGTLATHHFRWAEVASAAPARGRLTVSTDPAGGTVSIDGIARGTSPLSIDDLEPGDHQVVVQMLGRTHRRTVTIEAGAAASLVLSNTPAPVAADVGWLTARAGTQLQIFERGRRLGTSDERIVLSPGNHDLEFVADDLGFRTRRTVHIVAGQNTTATMSLPQAGVNLNAVPWADVIVDGKDMGQTPIANLMLPIGSHQVTFRHPQFGEKQATVVVSLQEPARVAVDMRGR